MNKKIKAMFKKMNSKEISIQQWWDFIAGENHDEVKEVVEKMNAIIYRLKDYKNGFHYSTKILKYVNRSIGSDCYPYEVVKIISDKCIEIRAMETKQIVFPKQFHIGGFSAHCSDNYNQEYEYIANENAEVFRIRKGKKGWGYGKFWMSNNPTKFYDYNF